MRTGVALVVLVLVPGLGGCGPGTRPSNRAAGPTAPVEVLEKAGAPEQGKTRYCVELPDSGGFDCQPSTEKCTEYAVFLEEEGYAITAETRCHARVVVCASYQTGEGGEELCGRDREECEQDRTALLEWDGVVDGSVGPCQ